MKAPKLAWLLINLSIPGMAEAHDSTGARHAAMQRFLVAVQLSVPIYNNTVSYIDAHLVAVQNLRCVENAIFRIVYQTIRQAPVPD